MIRLHNVEQVYQRRSTRLVTLQVEHLEVSAGEFVAVLGPSGSGKTTLLSLLGGMLSPSCGHIWIADQRLTELTAQGRAALRRQKIGFVFQTFNLIPYLSALENVQAPLSLAGVPGDQQRTRAAALLVRLGMGDRLAHKPGELSIGQQQRVALARTLANDPAIILADEPTGNLDAESRERVLSFFDELHRDGRTVVLVTHDAVAAQRAQRQIYLREGQLIQPAGEKGSVAA